jgi:hypothetical protein
MSGDRQAVLDPREESECKRARGEHSIIANPSTQTVSPADLNRGSSASRVPQSTTETLKWRPPVVGATQMKNASPAG